MPFMARWLGFCPIVLHFASYFCAAQSSQIPLLSEPSVEQYQRQFHDSATTIHRAVTEGGVLQGLECGACQGILYALKGLAAVGGEDAVQSALHGVCDLFDVSIPEVCRGIADLQGPPLAYMVQNIDPDSEQGKLFCYSAFSLQLCPRPEIAAYEVKFPKSKPDIVIRPKGSGELVNVAHLSDYHVDYQYTAGGEAQCDTFLCCRGLNVSSSTVTRAAGKWGDYNCDGNELLTSNLIKSIPKVSGQPRMAILTGDIDPHNIWSDDVNFTSTNIDRAYTDLHSLFDAQGVPLYAAIGNHDAGPVNQYDLPSEFNPPMITYLYKLLANKWNGWIPQSSQEKVATNGHGSYSLVLGDAGTLRLISLNTNLAYSLNFYLYPRTNESDPAGILEWLVDELQAAEDSGQAAWIISHVPTAGGDSLQAFSNYFLQIVRRYSETITFIGAGHTHRDEFNVFYNRTSDPKEVQRADAISWAAWGPSATPYTNLNPGWRVYRVDSGSWEIMDSLTYIANLDQADSFDANGGPNWHLEYSAREYVPNWAPDAPLNATFWHQATLNFEHNLTAFDRYFMHRSKSSGLDGSCAAGEQCAHDIIANLRTSESSYWTKASSNHGLVTLQRQIDSRGINPRSGQHWQQSLCSPHVA
ncbi:sphingomyelin phosphodiesterase [Tilletiaria anomala UBC 951]|uniref:Sphingomyelin phosphodiesterase n=1 Tax=Tilletiaria anomala (strain ATCC 24038 / CBS 436.72 / UBC 951) TaxID=1037660 RepID=A0A066WES3_TILAU|nr:sphingomyelin phosphodiesterase [Tilletiaria anomala UBC 951]KDN52437.1 sphingomyelin phosphodiesterase [Tilletiaria anomala UBC 951]